MGRIVIETTNSLYCNATNGNAQVLLRVNHVLIGIYKLRPRIDGSAPAVFGVNDADGYEFVRPCAVAGSFS